VVGVLGVRVPMLPGLLLCWVGAGLMAVRCFAATAPLACGRLPSRSLVLALCVVPRSTPVGPRPQPKRAGV